MAITETIEVPDLKRKACEYDTLLGRKAVILAAAVVTSTEARRRDSFLL
jgi:hypothetical protein